MLVVDRKQFPKSQKFETINMFKLFNLLK